MAEVAMFGGITTQENHVFLCTENAISDELIFPEILLQENSEIMADEPFPAFFPDTFRMKALSLTQ